MAGRVTAVDHVGFVVTNLDDAVRFFVEVLGFTDIARRGGFEDAKADRMTRLFGVDARAVVRYAFVELNGGKVELLEWDAADRAGVPRNSDLGGRHLALAVADLDDLVEQLRSLPGVVVRERNERGFYYVGTPFGLEIQLTPA
jgi:catechol 2,3-dioxygenase-like lactoylglutathione lyase family enzyme